MDTTFPDPAAHQPRPTLSEEERERSLRHRESPERRGFMELLAGHRRGRLFVEDATGHRLMFGAPLSLPLSPFAHGLAPEARMLVRDEAFFGRFLAHPGQGLAEGYHEGLWESASPESVVAFLLQRTGSRGPAPTHAHAPAPGILPRLRQALLGRQAAKGDTRTQGMPAAEPVELPAPTASTHQDGRSLEPADLAELWDSLPLRRSDQLLVVHPELHAAGVGPARAAGCRVALLARTPEHAARLRAASGTPAGGAEVLSPAELGPERRFDRILACAPFITAEGGSPASLAGLLARHLKPNGQAAIQVAIETRRSETLNLDTSDFLSTHAPGLCRPLAASELLAALEGTGVLQVHSWTDVSKKASQTTAARLAALRSRAEWQQAGTSRETGLRALELCLSLHQASLALREIQACRLLLCGAQNAALP